MKRIALVAAACAVAIFGVSSGAHAQSDDDNYLDPSVEILDDGTVLAHDCIPGEIVEFEFEGDSQTAICNSDGKATAKFPAPECPPGFIGDITFTGTATFTGEGAIDPEIDTSNRPLTRTFSITLKCGTIPNTGSSGTGSFLAAGGILLLAGLGMVAVSQLRRRQALA
ncbi:MAG: LPXTG cell wall anchor domain-containing protein [Actinomycetota bacterium]